MVERNELCPCGSGKKYKKCCMMKSERVIVENVDEKLEQILIDFFEKPFDSSVIAELEKYEEKWSDKLAGHLSEEQIEAIVVEYYFFVVRRDLWNRYLLKVLNQPLRTNIREVVELWKNPLVLFGRVTEKTDDYFLVEEILGDQVYQLHIEEYIETREKGLLVFGIVLPDNRVHENGVRLLNGVNFTHDENDEIEAQVIEMAKTSGKTTSHEFFKEYMLDVFLTVGQTQFGSFDDFLDSELSDKQMAVLTAIEEKTKGLIIDELLKVVKMVAAIYLTEEQPRFSKPEVIAGATIIAADEVGLLGFQSFTKSEIAKMFGVSVSAMSKHGDKLVDYAWTASEEIETLLNPEEDGYFAGTDPNEMEMIGWEVYNKAKELKLDPDDFEQIEKTLKKSAAHPFKPKSDHDKAQALAYEAYKIPEVEDRHRLAEKAFKLNSQNIDALLLKAQLSETVYEAEKYYRAAVQLGPKTYKDEMSLLEAVTILPYHRALFSYGIFLYEEVRVLEAAELFEQLLMLNSENQQQACYFAVASYIRAEELERASEILEYYREDYDDEVPFLFLEWMIEMDKTEGESQKGLDMYNDICLLNPYIDAFMEEDMPPGHMPTKLYITPGSIEEAFYVSLLM